MDDVFSQWILLKERMPPANTKVYLSVVSLEYPFNASIICGVWMPDNNGFFDGNTRIEKPIFAWFPIPILVHSYAKEFTAKMQHMVEENSKEAFTNKLQGNFSNLPEKE